MRLHLVSPDNPGVSLNVTLIDENFGHRDYERPPKPDPVGITAFSSQAPQAYEIAATHRSLGLPVMVGGTHARFCHHEALEHADAVVTGEARSVWARALIDTRTHRLDRVYEGGLPSMDAIPNARHDLPSGKHYSGSVQTTRGCPLKCRFCSVTALKAMFQHGPAADMVREIWLVHEKVIIFLADNLIATRCDHFECSKDLFRAMKAGGFDPVLEWIAWGFIRDPLRRSRELFSEAKWAEAGRNWTPSRRKFRSGGRSRDQIA